MSKWEMVESNCLSFTTFFYSLDTWQETSFEVSPPRKLTSGALEWDVDVLSVSRVCGMVCKMLSILFALFTRKEKRTETKN